MTIKRTETAKLSPLQYESYVAYQLFLQGFKGVHTTSKTGDYGADILCFDLIGHSCAIQCKLYSKPVGYKAVQEALAGAKYYNCRRAIVVCNTSYTKNAIKGAKKLGVELFVCKYHPKEGYFGQIR